MSAPSLRRDASIPPKSRCKLTAAAHISDLSHTDSTSVKPRCSSNAAIHCDDSTAGVRINCLLTRLAGQPPDSRSTTASPAVLVNIEDQPQPAWSHLGTTHWLLTTAIMLSDMFGLGTLSLPADFARLGWIPALACLVWFAVADIYAGIIYQRLSLKVPTAVVFDEIGYAALGRLGSAAVYATIYFSILLQPIMLHLTCMESLRQVTEHQCSGSAVLLASVRFRQLLGNDIPADADMTQRPCAGYSDGRLTATCTLQQPQHKYYACTVVGQCSRSVTVESNHLARPKPSTPHVVCENQHSLQHRSGICAYCCMADLAKSCLMFRPCHPCLSTDCVACNTTQQSQ